MTREHLLEAMGLLDDDLIAQAEEPARRRPRPPVRRWAALAACLALVLALGYQGARLWPGGGNANTSGGNQTGQESAGSATGGSAAPTDPGTAGDGSANDSHKVLIVIVQADGRVWSYQHWYGEDRVLDALPEGCRSLGRVGAYAEGEDCVYTDMGQFPDAPLWIAGEDMGGPVYLELPGGGYLECR